MFLSENWSTTGSDFFLGITFLVSEILHHSFCTEPRKSASSRDLRTSSFMGAAVALFWCCPLSCFAHVVFPRVNSGHGLSLISLIPRPPLGFHPTPHNPNRPSPLEQSCPGPQA